MVGTPDAPFNQSNLYETSRWLANIIRRTVTPQNSRGVMVGYCANEGCNAEFLYLHSGTLYVYQCPDKGATYAWLCETCCQYLRIQFDATGTVKVVPRTEVLREATAAA